MRQAAPGSVHPLQRPLDPEWRQRYIAGADPLACFRGGLSRAAWRALAPEDRARVLDTTAPLPPGSETPTPGTATTQTPAPAATRSTAPVLQCCGCGDYFPVRHGRRALAWCRASKVCEPGHGIGRRARRRVGLRKLARDLAPAVAE